MCTDIHGDLSLLFSLNICYIYVIYVRIQVYVCTAWNTIPSNIYMCIYVYGEVNICLCMWIYVCVCGYIDIDSHTERERWECTDIDELLRRISSTGAGHTPLFSTCIDIDLYVCICMYVCNVCMYVCMYVCMCVSLSMYISSSRKRHCPNNVKTLRLPKSRPHRPPTPHRAQNTETRGDTETERERERRRRSRWGTSRLLYQAHGERGRSSPLAHFKHSQQWQISVYVERAMASAALSKCWPSQPHSCTGIHHTGTTHTPHTNSAPT